MNQGRIWCVVNPTVGLPLFLGSVALTSLIVHGEVLNHTTWFSGYWNGKAGKVAAIQPAETVAPAAVLAPAAPASPAAPAKVAALAVTATPQAPTPSQ